MKYIVVIVSVLTSLPRAWGAVSCAPRLSSRDLTLEALTAIHKVPEFKPAIWEFALNSNSGTPFVLVVGPDSRRKADAIKAVVAQIPRARAYDVPTRTPEGFAAGLTEFHVAAWLADVPLHILDVGVPRDFDAREWRDLAAASTSLVRLGFSEFEIMGVAGVYFVAP